MKHFSERESAIIKILGRKKMTIREISDELFKEEKNTLDAETKVTNCLSRIIKKCEAFDLPWSLERKRIIGSTIKEIKKIKR